MFRNVSSSKTSVLAIFWNQFLFSNEGRQFSGKDTTKTVCVDSIKFSHGCSSRKDWKYNVFTLFLLVYLLSWRMYDICREFGADIQTFENFHTARSALKRKLVLLFATNAWADFEIANCAHGSHFNFCANWCKSQFANFLMEKVWKDSGKNRYF